MFAGITTGAMVFLLRFLVAICGPLGKAPQTAYLAKVAPHAGTPDGESEVNGHAAKRVLVAHHRVANTCERGHVPFRKAG